MSDLFEYNPIEDVDREFMDYVGVHPLSWYDCKEPAAAFVESKYTAEMFDELLAACEVAMRFAYYCDDSGRRNTILLELRAAIANAKGATDA